MTAPVDARLPGGGGNLICGLYDIKPAKFGVASNNLVTFADNFGSHTQTFDGFDFILNARPRAGLTVNGGFSTGLDREADCDVIDSPEKRFCETSTGWQTSAKASAAYTLPWQDIQFGAVFQNLPGQQILATWPITSATPGLTLGRAFSGGGSRNIALIEPGTVDADRRSQLDVRLAKTFRVGGGKRLQAMVDIYNALNSNAPVGATSQAGETPPSLNTTHGSSWLTPLNILQARYVKFGAQFNF